MVSRVVRRPGGSSPARTRFSPQQRGVSATRADLLIGLIGVGNIGGRLAMGSAADRVGPRRLLLWLTLMLVALNIGWLGARDFAWLSVFAVLFGVANGGCISLYPSVALQEVTGPKRPRDSGQTHPIGSINSRAPSPCSRRSRTP